MWEIPNSVKWREEGATKGTKMGDKGHIGIRISSEYQYSNGLWVLMLSCQTWRPNGCNANCDEANQPGESNQTGLLQTILTQQHVISKLDFFSMQFYTVLMCIHFHCSYGKEREKNLVLETFRCKLNLSPEDGIGVGPDDAHRGWDGRQYPEHRLGHTLNQRICHNREYTSRFNSWLWIKNKRKVDAELPAAAWEEQTWHSELSVHSNPDSNFCVKDLSILQ